MKIHIVYLTFVIYINVCVYSLAEGGVHFEEYDVHDVLGYYPSEI